MGKTGKPVAQPASTANYEKIPGTKLKMLKGGIPVRVVHATGQEFHPNDVSGAWHGVEKAGQDGGGQQKGKGKGNGKGKQGQQKGQVKLQAVQQKGKSKGGSKGQVQFKTPPAIKNSTKGTGKGTGKGSKGEGAKGGKQIQFKAAATGVKKKILKNGKGGGKGGKRAQKPRKEQTPEEEEARKEKQAERHIEKIEKEMRMLVNDTYFTGEVVSRGKFFAWVKPQSPPIPASVLPELTKMNDEFRAKSANNSDGKKQRPFCNGIEENVVYVAFPDIQEDDLKLTEGLAVRFKLYTDSKGVGGCEVVSA